MIGVASMLAAFEIWRLLPHFLTPTVIKLPYFDWLPLLPTGSVVAFILLWVLAAIAFVIGWKTRIAGAVLACVIGYSLLLDQQLYSNHLYLLFLVVVLLTIADSGAAISMDARQAERGTVPGWPIWLLKVQISIVYIFSAIAKLTPQYLSGEVLTESLKQYGFLTIPMAWRMPVAMRAAGNRRDSYGTLCRAWLMVKTFAIGSSYCGRAFPHVHHCRVGFEPLVVEYFCARDVRSLFIVLR